MTSGISAGDHQYTPNVSFFDLTKTEHADLLAENRCVTLEEDDKLFAVALLVEDVIACLGGPVDIHSGRRCMALNSRVGGTARSQHLKCEAVDLSPAGPDTEESVTAAWQKLATAARAGKIRFGQLILESQGKREGRVWWIHVSLGTPYRLSARCGEIATQIDGKFVMISQVV